MPSTANPLESQRGRCRPLHSTEKRRGKNSEAKNAKNNNMMALFQRFFFFAVRFKKNGLFRFSRTSLTLFLNKKKLADQTSDSTPRDHHFARAFLHQAGPGAVDQARHTVSGGYGGTAEVVRQGPLVRQHHRVLGEVSRTRNETRFS